MNYKRSQTGLDQIEWQLMNVSKTKFILFHTIGKKINEDELNVVLNMNEIGKTKIEDPARKNPF